MSVVIYFKVVRLNLRKKRNRRWRKRKIWIWM